MSFRLGQGSGDFTETRNRAQMFYPGWRTSIDDATPDSFTQRNPPNILTNVSTTLSGINKRGVLGGSVLFTRPDYGNGFVGGPPSANNPKVRVLGLSLADMAGEPFENTAFVASQRPTYYSEGGGYGVTIWETHNLDTGAPLVYSMGDELYASKNGYLTNVADDDNTYEQGSLRTLVGLCKMAPDSDTSLLVFCLKV